MPTATRPRVGGREPLLAAALKLIARDGAGSMTMRAVADAAGVSPGTVTYHFESAESLLIEALESAAMATATMLERLALDLQDADRDLDGWVFEFASALATDLEQRRDNHIACLELQLLAARRPEFAPIAARVQLAYFRVARMAAQVGGVDDVDAVAVRLTAMVTGLVLAEVIHRQPDAEQRLRSAMLGLICEIA